MDFLLHAWQSRAVDELLCGPLGSHAPLEVTNFRSVCPDLWLPLSVSGHLSVMPLLLKPLDTVLLWDKWIGWFICQETVGLSISPGHGCLAAGSSLPGWQRTAPAWLAVADLWLAVGMSVVWFARVGILEA